MKKLCFIFAFIAFSLSIKAYDISVKNSDGILIYYDYINNGTELEVKGYLSPNDSSNIIIPEEVTYSGKTRKVTSIGTSAFSDSNSKSITIPNTITNIGDNAFENTAIKTLDIPSSVTNIGEYAFLGSDIESITIPSSVTNIGRNAFDNTKLVSITIPNSITELKGDMFAGCNYLKEINLPNSLITIDDGCFSDCGILTSIVIPNSVTEIGSMAFSDDDSLETVILPYSLKEINSYSFFKCGKLKSINIPTTLKKIGRNAFSYCIQLKHVSPIPDGVVEIDEEAFRDCAIDTLFLPENLKLIGDMAFRGCDSLLTIISKMKSPCQIGYSTFSMNTTCNASLYVPKGSIPNYKADTYWQNFVFISDDYSEATPQKCATPTISYYDKKLEFFCSTPFVKYQSSIRCSDAKSSSTDIVNLDAIYDISVYAWTNGYANSDIVTAKLYWIDASLDASDVNNVQVNSRGVLVQNDGDFLTISGLNNNEKVELFTTSGVIIGTSNATISGTATFNISKLYKIVIAKLGNESIKICLDK
jgi:hypothetical protein